MAARVSRFRWLIHLVVLGSYPLLIGVLGQLSNQGEAAEATPALSGDPVALVTGVVMQLGFFFVLFALAWAASRVNAQQLMLPWRGGLGPVWRGLLYSVGLRLVVLMVVLVAGAAAIVLGGLDEQALRELRPKVENTVDMEVLAEDPLYLVLNVTLVSFVLAGFTEELWRVGVLAGLRSVFPRLFESLRGKVLAVAMVAIVFGLGHYSQGWGGVVITTVLGAGLGAILLFHGCIWDAVIAHGCLDASTFVLLFLLFQFFPEFNLDFGG